MAVVVNNLASRVQMKFNTGTDTDGKIVYKTKSLGDIKPSATNEDVMAIVQELAGLQQHSMTMVIRINQSELING